MSPWQCRILKPQSSAIRDDLNGSKPRMHSFEAMLQASRDGARWLLPVTWRGSWGNARIRSAFVSDDVG
jgi:hypothetical protein